MESMRRKAVVMTARETVLMLARERGLRIYEDGSRVNFGYFQVSFTESGNWLPASAYGPRLSGGRASLKSLVQVLRDAPNGVIAPSHLFEQ